jgi:ribosome-associated protein
MTEPSAGPDPVDVPIRDQSIRLGQFLKLANLIESGSEAKPVLAQGSVTVNGEVETRRGRQLVLGDVVVLGGVAARVSDESAGDNLPW